MRECNEFHVHQHNMAIQAMAAMEQDKNKRRIDRECNEFNVHQHSMAIKAMAAMEQDKDRRRIDREW